MDKPKKEPAFTLRLSKEAADALVVLAKSQRRSKTATIEVLVIEAAARQAI